MSQRQAIGIDDPIPAGDWLKSPWARKAALRHGCEDRLRRRWRSIRDKRGHAHHEQLPGWRPNVDTQDLGSCRRDITPWRRAVAPLKMVLIVEDNELNMKLFLSPHPLSLPQRGTA